MRMIYLAPRRQCRKIYGVERQCDSNELECCERKGSWPNYKEHYEVCLNRCKKPTANFFFLIISQIAMAKAAFNKKKNLFYQQIGLKFEEETSEMLRLEHGSLWC